MPVPPKPPRETGLGKLIQGAWNELRKAAPTASRASISYVLRTLASNRDCIEVVARVMVEDEGMDWTTLATDQRRIWMYRARAALSGLHRYVFRTGERASDDGEKPKGKEKDE